MKYEIVFQKAAIKFVKKQDRKTQERLLNAISRLPDGTDKKISIKSEETNIREWNYI